MDYKYYSYWHNNSGHWQHNFVNDDKVYVDTIWESGKLPELSITDIQTMGNSGEYRFLAAYKTGPKSISFIENERETFRRYF